MTEADTPEPQWWLPPIGYGEPAVPPAPAPGEPFPPVPEESLLAGSDVFVAAGADGVRRRSPLRRSGIVVAGLVATLVVVLVLSTEVWPHGTQDSRGAAARRGPAAATSTSLGSSGAPSAEATAGSGPTPTSGHLPLQLSTPGLSPTTTSSTVGASTLPPVAPSGGSSVAEISPSVENGVVTSVWVPFAQAFADGDTAAMTPYVDPAARLAIAGSYHCGCGGWPTAYTSVGFSGPSFQAYPASFLAEIVGQSFEGQQETREVVFTRASVTSPWLIAFLSAYVGAPPLLGTSGQDVTTGASGVPANLAQAPQHMADFLQTLDATGKEPALPPGFQADNILNQKVSADESNYQRFSSAGDSVAPTHEVEEQSPVFAVPGGWIVCGATAFNETVTAPPGSVLTQAAEGGEWSSELAPGTYSTVTEDGMDMSCYVATSDTDVRWYTTMGGPYATSGSPA